MSPAQVTAVKDVPTHARCAAHHIACPIVCGCLKYHHIANVSLPVLRRLDTSVHTRSHASLEVSRDNI